jgi:HK97 family phage portal protein
VLKEILGGLGLEAMNDPAPSAGMGATLSGSSYIDFGAVELVPSMGQRRWATFREIYITNPWVWAAVNVLARGIARTPIGVFQNDADGFPNRIRGDIPQTPGRLSAGAALDRLLANPTPGVSRGAFWGGVVRDKLIYGNGLARFDRPGGGGAPIGMRRVAWRKVARVETDADDMPLYYEFRRRRGDFNPERVLPADVIHFGLCSDEGALGVSPLMACRATLALHDAVVRHLLGYFKNSARTSGHIQVERLTRDKAIEIRDLISEMYASPENAGKILVTSGMWQSTSDSPDNAQIAELMQESRIELAAAYTIPPPVLGILDRAIKSNVEQLRTQHVRDGLGPLGTDVTDDVDAQLGSQTPGWAQLDAKFMFDEQLQPDPEGLSLFIQRTNAVLTVDEQRGKLGKAPLKIPGISDVPWSTPGSSPLSAGGKAGSAGPPRSSEPSGA